MNKIYPQGFLKETANVDFVENTLLVEHLRDFILMKFNNCVLFLNPRCTRNGKSGNDLPIAQMVSVEFDSVEVLDGLRSSF